MTADQQSTRPAGGREDATWSRSPSTASRSSVPKGTLVIRAAEQIGVQIPRFCDHPLLAPVGACRQCLVERCPAPATAERMPPGA